MNAHTDLDEDSTENKRICNECVGEPYLKQEIAGAGLAAECFYCGKTGSTISIGDLADRVDVVFKTHYQPTANEPSSWQAAVMKDSESSYSWEREGNSVADIIADIAMIDDQAAEDTHEVLNDRHYDFEAAKMGEEGEFDGDVTYQRRQPDDERLRETWSRFQNALKTEARKFNRAAESALDEMFSDLSEHGTKEGEPAIVVAGPGQRIATLFRARVFVPSDRLLISAIERPDKEVGPLSGSDLRPRFSRDSDDKPGL